MMTTPQNDDELQRLRVLLAGQSTLTSMAMTALQAVVATIGDDPALAGGPVGERVAHIVNEWEAAHRSVWHETDASTEGGLSALANTGPAADSPAPVLVQ